MKKIVSAILAGACAVSAMSLSASALSNKDVSTAGEVKLSASAVVATPEVSVSVPSSIAAVINPYGTKVTVKGVEYGKTGVASPVYTIINKTTSSPIQVSVKPTIAVPTTKVSVLVTSTANPDGKATSLAQPYITVATATFEDNAEADAKKIFAWVQAKADTTGIEIVTPAQETADKALDSPTGLVANVDSKGNLLKDPTNVLGDIKWASTGCVAFTDVTVGYTGLTAGEKIADTALEGKALGNKTEAEVKYGDLMKIKAAEGTAGSPTKVYYGNFAIGGNIDSAPNWDSSDKITFNVVLKIGPAPED